MSDHKQVGDFVEVFDTAWEPEAMVVRSLLDGAGIASVVSGLDAPPDVLPGVGGIVIRVPQEQAAEARRVIDEHRRTSPDDDTGISGEPAA